MFSFSDGTTSTSINGTTSTSTDGRTSTSTDDMTSTSTDDTTSTSTDGTTSTSIDNGDIEITMEDFLELEEFLQLEDGEKLEDLDLSREVTMEDFLELEEWLEDMDQNLEKKRDDDQHTSRGDLETSPKASIDRHQPDELDRQQPHIIDQRPPYIIDRHPPDSIELHPPDCIDRHPSLEELPGYIVDLENVEERMYMSKASHLIVPKHQRPPIWTEEAVGFHKRVKRIHDPVKIVVPCAVFEAESPIPPDRSMQFSSSIEVLDDHQHVEASQRGLRFRDEVDKGPAEPVSIDTDQIPSIDTNKPASIDTTTSPSEKKKFDVCGNLRNGDTTTRSDKYGGKKRRNWKKRKTIKDGPQVSLIPHFSDGVRKFRVRSRCFSQPFAKLRAILIAEMIDKGEKAKPHTAGNTSSREDNTTPNRSNQIQHKDYQLVPASSGSYPQIRLSADPGSYWFLLIRSPQTTDLLAPSLNLKASLYIHWPLLVSVSTAKHASTAVGFNIPNQGQSPPTSGLVDSKLKTPPIWESKEEFLGTPQAYQATTKRWIERLLVLINFHWSCSAKGSLPKRREHCFSASCKGAEEKRELYIKTCWPSDSWAQLEQRRVKEAGEHTFQVLFISGFRVPASRSQIPGHGSKVLDPGPGSPATHLTWRSASLGVDSYGLSCSSTAIVT
ncbi:hypothetical protein F2Q70_00043607 [Brassica cretica]|uniref:Uncharacterized protein n=1 Tax=Brassica cretica TaxID=69181 RepID=A0A8S9KKF0_BRACR|nr:hypothetical protein F2Q70_00043607 [Brassica cretica]